jgi:hypothetical protein
MAEKQPDRTFRLINLESPKDFVARMGAAETDGARLSAVN